MDTDIRDDFRVCAADVLRWLEARLTVAKNGIGRVLPRSDLHHFREKANELWWQYIRCIEPAFPPDDLDDGFAAFESALGWQDGAHIIAVAVAAGSNPSRALPSGGIDLTWDGPYCERIASALKRMAGEAKVKSHDPKAEDLSAYRPAAELWRQRKHEIANSAACNAFLKKHPEIRTHKPNLKELSIHAGDWLEYWSQHDAMANETMDTAAIQAVIEGVEERKADAHKQKRAAGKQRKTSTESLGQVFSAARKSAN